METVGICGLVFKINCSSDITFRFEACAAGERGVIMEQIYKSSAPSASVSVQVKRSNVTSEGVLATSSTILVTYISKGEKGTVTWSEKRQSDLVL